MAVVGGRDLAEEGEARWEERVHEVQQELDWLI
jgi:hypothetical protein